MTTRNYPSNFWIRITEPLRLNYYGPRQRLRILKQSLAEDVKNLPQGFYRKVELEDLIDIIYEQVGLEDIPINTILKGKDKNSIGMSFYIVDLLESIVEGEEVYQYIIQHTPEWIKKRKKKTTYTKPNDNFIPAKIIAEIKGVTEQSVGSKASTKKIKGIQYQDEWYIEPTYELDCWMTDLKNDVTSLYRRLQIINDVLAIYKGNSIKELYKKADDLEKQGNVLIGRYARSGIKRHMEEYYGAFVPISVKMWRDTINILLANAKNKRDLQLNNK